MIDVCNIQVMKPMLAAHGFHFSKAKGQNFLIAPWVPQSIAEQAGVDETAGVLEIGPGIGPLTQQLCLRAGKVCAVEVDERLKPILDVTVGNFSNLEILWGDVLKQDIPALVKEKFGTLRPMACANLPYYITSPILTALLEAECFQSVTVMVQKEVAQRIAAKPGTPDYSAFTVFCQYYAEPEILFEVSRGSFMPAPNVDSAVIQLRIRKKGSAGGHNGIKNIIAHLGTQEFPRIKVGVGDKPPRMDLADYVLSRFSKEDREKMEQAFKDAAEAVEVMIAEGPDAAMNQFNGHK